MNTSRSRSHADAPSPRTTPPGQMLNRDGYSRRVANSIVDRLNAATTAEERERVWQRFDVELASGRLKYADGSEPSAAQRAEASARILRTGAE